MTGFAVYLGNNLVSWKSKKQSVLDRSSVEAEFKAMCNVTCEVMWILKVCKVLNVQVELVVEMFCDNSSAMQIAQNPVLHERSKHFEIDLFFIRDQISEGIIKTIKVKSENNIADIFTKGLSVVEHIKFCEMLKLKDLYKP